MPKRPRSVADCPAGPCPFVGCRHHNALEVTRFGRIRLRTADGCVTTADIDAVDIDALLEGETCSLRAASSGEHSLDDVGQLLGYTRQRVQQIEATALRKMREASDA